MDLKSRLLQSFVLAQKSLALLPLLFVMWNLHSKKVEIRELSQKVARMEQRAKKMKNQKEKQDLLWKQVEQAQSKSPHYIGQVIEKLPLLSSELRRVQALARHYPENRLVQERLTFLQGDRNKIQFIQQTQRSGSFFQESEMKLQHPVQMNEDDLRKFLVAVEGDDYSAKQLVIKDFELTKRNEMADEMVYNVQVEMIKRSP